MVRDLTDPDVSAAYARLLEAVGTAFETVSAALQDFDWSRVMGSVVLEAFDDWWEFRKRCLTFLPRTYDDLDPSVRVRLFVYRELTLAAEALTPRDLTDPPASPIGPLVLRVAAGPLAEAELRRRADTHPMGVEGALLLGSLAVNRIDPALGNPALTASVARLRRLIWKRCLRALTVVSERERLTRPDERQQELDGQILETLAARWGRVEPLKLIGSALDGKLDILARAIHDDLTDRARRARRRDATEVPLPRLASPAHPEAASEDRPDVDHLPADGPQPDQAVHARQVLDQIRRDPRWARYLDAALVADTQVEIAQRLGITDRTVRNIVRELKELFGRELTS